MSPSRSGRGRPLKFGRPAQAVTLTLPVDILHALKSMHADLALAIVEMVNRQASRRRRPSVALAHYGHRAVIVVRPVRALKRIPGVELVPFGDPDRALISWTEPMTIAEFELRIQDVIDTGELRRDEQETLQHLAATLKEARRSGQTSLAERTIIVLEADRPPRRRSSRMVSA